MQDANTIKYIYLHVVTTACTYWFNSQFTGEPV